MKARLLTAALLLAPIQAEAAQRLVSSPFSQSFVDKLPLNTPASTMWACSIRYLGTRPVHVLFSVRTGPNQVGVGSLDLSAATPFWSSVGGGCTWQDGCRDVVCMFTVPGRKDDYRASLCISAIDGSQTSCLPAY